MSALIPGHDAKTRGVIRSTIFAFAFIAPLRAEDREIHIELRFYFVTADHTGETPQEIFERVRGARVKKKKFSFSIDNVRAAS